MLELEELEEECRRIGATDKEISSIEDKTQLYKKKELKNLLLEKKYEASVREIEALKQNVREENHGDLGDGNEQIRRDQSGGGRGVLPQNDMDDEQVMMLCHQLNMEMERDSTAIAQDPIEDVSDEELQRLLNEPDLVPSEFEDDEEQEADPEVVQNPATPQEGYSCQYCRKPISRWYRRFHHEMHENGRLLCHVCGKTYSNKITLTRHLRMMH